LIFTKKKGQGALEYLLLIGGAVLIAVIVIALLVGMGGQSRDSAQDQSNKVQQASDLPQPAQIVSITASYSNCPNFDEDQNKNSEVSFTWRPLGEGGTYYLSFYDSRDRQLKIASAEGHTIDSDGVDSLILDPTDLTLDINILRLNTTEIVHNCGDSYYAQIITEKNNQQVKSSNFGFSWIPN